MKILRTTFILCALCLIASCDLPPLENMNDTAPVAQTEIREESSLFTASQNSTLFTFETNDTKYLTQNGYTLWTVPYINTSESFETITVTLDRQSGKKQAGFGIVFCSQTIDGKPFMLTLLINASGFYTAGKVYNGVFSHISGGWKSSPYIKKGNGVKNILTVSYDENSRSFVVKINGYTITAFTVTEQISFKDSKYGFAVVIANNEDFPTESVKVNFEVE